MKKLLTNLLPLYFLSIIFISCGAPTAEDTVTSDTTTTEQVNNQPSLDIVEDPIMEQDVVATTAEATPEHIDAEKIPSPEVLDASPAKKPSKAPGQPEKPRIDGNEQEAPMTKPTPPAVSTPSTGSEAPTPASASDESTEEPQKITPPSHETWNALLQQFVNSTGNVNYAAFKKEESRLDDYLAELAENAPTADWSRRESMAYWINAYNAATIKLILKNWPVKSITDLHGGKPWDVKWIELGGKTYSLNGIEHDILRPRYNDPGIHFAVNCAAVSCPPLPNKAFTPSNLTGLMASRAKAFIRNPAYNTIGETVAVSKIFDWYGEDFGNLRDYLNKYAATPIPEGKEIGFKEYDWALNKQ